MTITHLTQVLSSEDCICKMVFFGLLLHEKRSSWGTACLAEATSAALAIASHCRRPSSKGADGSRVPGRAGMSAGEDLSDRMEAPRRCALLLPRCCTHRGSASRENCSLAHRYRARKVLNPFPEHSRMHNKCHDYLPHCKCRVCTRFRCYPWPSEHCILISQDIPNVQVAGTNREASSSADGLLPCPTPRAAAWNSLG